LISTAVLRCHARGARAPFARGADKTAGTTRMPTWLCVRISRPGQMRCVLACAFAREREREREREFIRSAFVVCAEVLYRVLVRECVYIPTHTHTHTHSLSLSLTHTQTHTHTHTLSLSLSLTYMHTI
jgi:hypothetical protein